MRWASSHWNHYRSLLRACAREASLESGHKLHATLIKNGLEASPDTFLRNALLHMYVMCGTVSYARQMFDQIPQTHKDAIDWTTLMTCFARNGLPREALLLFRAMQRSESSPDEVTLVCFFTACSQLGDFLCGSQGHLYIIKHGLPFTVSSSNAAMDMYSKCGKICDAKRMFDEMGDRSVVSWTIILGGTIKRDGVGNGRKIFNEMPERNVVAWTVMIAGYIENGFTREAFGLIRELISPISLELNYVTLCSLLSACAQSGDLAMGRWVHVYSLRTMKTELHLMVGTALLDMYSKCGRIDRALKVFGNMPYRNVVTWNAMLSGLAMHGRGLAVLGLFPQLIAEVQPNDMTFVAVLSACSHSGLADQGCQYFKDMEPLYGITPKIEHYACLVDLLGRAGKLEEAETLVREMPIPPNEIVLGSLLAASGLHGKLGLGESLLQELIEIDPLNTEYHILLSNMYRVAGKEDEANYYRQVLKRQGVKKVPGMSSIRVNGQIHQFIAGDKSHPQTQDVYIMLDEMIQRLRSAGYVPNIGCQIFSVSEGGEVGNVNDMEEKEQMLFSHSEKLAIAFGLTSTRPGLTLHIFKNLRICQDCHTAVKLISDIYKREIVIRDRNRFHCFRQGTCSCSNYW